MNKTVSITLNPLRTEQLKDYYRDYLKENNGEYVLFMAKKNNTVITAYTSKKEEGHKILFSGDEALEEAMLWDEGAEYNNSPKKAKAEWICLENQIGSDEVGVGDFILPCIVVASFVRKKDLPLLKQFGVTDSKKINDQIIIELGNALAKKFFISKLTLPNEKYNELILRGENLNSIKAKMHNRALLNLLKQFPETKNIFVDQFCEPKLYYSYLNDPNEPQVTNVTFKTKGESYYPCVALSSIIARYSFLKEKEKLEAKYHMTFPCGSSEKVNEFAKAFIEKYGKDEFDKICKKNFANYKLL